MMTASVDCRITRAALMLAAAMTVASCDSFGNPLEAMSGKRSSPDEFAVLARKPLQMPRTTSLPAPRLGERSALEPNPEADAVTALMGGPVSQPNGPASAGETALLSAANASQEQSEIRNVLSLEEQSGESSGAYTPPSVFELFTDDGPTVPQGELIDPTAESQRLQVEGVAPTPVDPRADPEATEAPVQSAPDTSGNSSAKRGT